jgi:hypothetical protein
MKEILVTARKKDVDNLQELLEDTIHVVRREDDLVYITMYLHEEELDPFLTALQNTLDLR